MLCLDPRILPGEHHFTEYSASAHIEHPHPLQYSTVGCIVPSLEVKLHDYPEADYLSSNDPPQGEIWLRGGSVTRGYYKRPDITKESFTDDGWFRTGDIGQVSRDYTACERHHC